MFAGSMGIYVVPFQIGALMDSLGLSAMQSGLLGTLEIGAMSITTLVLAPMLGRWPLSRVALGGGLLAAFGELLTAVSTSVGVVPITRLLTGIGCGGIYGAVNAAVARTDNPDRLYAQGLAFMNLAFLVLFLILPRMLVLGGHPALFGTLGIIFLLLQPVLRRVSLAAPSGAASPEIESAPPIAWQLVRLHFLATIFVNLGLGALWGFVERMGLDVGMSVAQVGAALSATSLAMIGGCLFAAWLGTSAGRLLPLVLGTLITGVAALAVALAPVPAAYVVALMISEAAYLFLSAYLIAGVTSALDPSGRVAAACGGVMFLSYSMGISTGGLIADTWSLALIGWFALGNCLLAAPLFALVVHRLEAGPHAGPRKTRGQCT
ncbi:MAG: hypothetical protein A3H91_09575 [Gammaproteobacteria bacterium RIFCSPLOWO2_02_FULL_61_13]|nr:MAG: hypothetical protein A3H91_09575 [Gammaproteobacteria bacterium RIFCSPLOWO2_02_FULL_61_13]